MKKEKMVDLQGNIYGYEILLGKPNDIDEDFEKFKKAVEIVNLNGKEEVIYHINLYPKTLIKYQEEISLLLSLYKNIVIELVEMNSSACLNKISKIINDNNINISIDDFGSGSSNFDRLELPNIKSVKFDKSFWIKANKNVITSIITSLKVRNIKVIAEQVENNHDLEIAKGLMFDIFQGYLFNPLSKNLEVVDNENKR